MACPVDRRPRDGRHVGPRLSRRQRIYGFDDGSIGTKCTRRRMAPCVPPMSIRRPTQQPFRRQDGAHDQWETILPTGAARRVLNLEIGLGCIGNVHSGGRSPISLYDLCFGGGAVGPYNPTSACEGTCPGDLCYPDLAPRPDCACSLADVCKLGGDDDSSFGGRSSILSTGDCAVGCSSAECPMAHPLDAAGVPPNVSMPRKVHVPKTPSQQEVRGR